MSSDDVHPTETVCEIPSTPDPDLRNDIVKRGPADSKCWPEGPEGWLAHALG
jgi:hypothetical protein